MDDRTRNTIMKTISEHLDEKPEDIRMDAKFGPDLGADGLDIVEIIMSLEDSLELELADVEIDEGHTVQALFDHVEKMQALS